MPESKDRILWQHPYVNIFKQFKVDNWKRASKEGDVSSVMDKQLKCTVYRILGSVPAGNYIQLPCTTAQSLGLTGRYIYFLFKPLPTKHFVVHMDTATEEGMVIRISFSNLFKEFKCTSTWLQFPFACQAAKGSIEHATAKGARTDMIAAAPLAQRWTMLVMDLNYILSVYINRKYSHVKSLKVCSNTMMKNIFTSDIEYDPRLTFRKARELGIKSVEENLAPMPREMNFFIPKNKSWDDCYDLIRFPTYPKDISENPVLPFDSIQPSQVRQHSKVHKVRTSNGPPGVVSSPRRQQNKSIHTGKNVGLYTTAQNTVTVATAAKTQPHHKPMKVVEELPEVGLQLMKASKSTFCEDEDVNYVESDAGDVHVFADTISKRDVVVHRHFASKNANEERVASVEPLKHSVVISPKAAKLKSFGVRKSRKKENDTIGFETSLKPDPIIKLKQIIGFGSSGIPYSHKALWHPESELSGGSDIIVYATHAILVAMELGTGNQHFFVGHTGRISAISFNKCSRKTSTIPILASAQSENGGLVRIWKFETQKCACIVKCQRAQSIDVLAFSHSGGILVGCGRDSNGKSLLIVWDTGSVFKHGTVTVIARASVDVQISHLCICPTDDTRLVTCCRDNIRFWRVRSGQLRSCPVNLSDHKIGEITNITFAQSQKVTLKNQSLPVVNVGPNKTNDSVYACTKNGYIIEVDFQNVQVKNMHKILPTMDKSDNSGIALNVVRFAESYIATGSDDGYLRLWPTDLSTVFLEAKHEGPVTDIDITTDGMKVLAATSAGTLGFLDVSTRKYSTLMRSHTDKIADSCSDLLRGITTTCSSDGSIRIWDNESRRQVYDFATSNDVPVAITCHQCKHVFACGFEDGSVRVFHVAKTTLLAEHRLHSGQITGIVFVPSGKSLVSAGEKGTIVLYDTSDLEKSGAPVIRSLPRAVARGMAYAPRSVAVSPDSRRIGFVGPTEYTVTVASASTLDELLRVDISTGLNLQPDILNKRPSLDAPLRVGFSSSKDNHLLVATVGNRLLKLDLQNGKLLSVVENLHRAKTTAICASEDGRYLVTGGDKLIKVWDYSMSKEINFQIFIGHNGPIHHIMFSGDQKTLITCGEDSIFYWDFLGEHTPCKKGTSVLDMVGSRAVRDVSPAQMIPTRDTDTKQPLNNSNNTPQPRKTAPQPVDDSIHSVHHVERSEYVPPETLRTVDLDASDVSDFTIDENMISKLAKKKHYNRTNNKSNRAAPDPIKVSWGEKTANSVLSNNKKNKRVVKVDTENLKITGISERPNVLKHFYAHENKSTLAEQIYAPKSNEHCLELSSVIGYNGNGRGNMVWNPDTGIFAYSVGCIVVVEDLTTAKKTLLRRHTEEISTMAMQYDCLILASASCSNGLIGSKICLWNMETDECCAELKHHEHDVVALAYSRDDRFLISIGDFRENTVVIWSAYDGHSSPVVLATSTTADPIHHIAWDLSTPNEFVTIGSNASINFWILQEVGEEVILQVDKVDVPDAVAMDTNRLPVAFTSAGYGDGHVLYIGSNTGLVSAWDTELNQCFLHWKADSAEICVLLAKGSRLLVAGVSKTLRSWSLAGIQNARMNNGDTCNLTMEDELSSQSEVTSAVFDESLEMGIIATVCGTLWYVDWNERTTVQLVTGHKKKITAVCFDNNGHFATGSMEGTVRLWSAENLELIVQFQVFNEVSMCAAFSNNTNNSVSCNMLAAGYGSGTIRVFDVNKLDLMLKLQPHSVSCTALAFSPDDSVLLSGGKDGRVAATSIATGVTLRVFDDHKGSPISNLTVSLRSDHISPLEAPLSCNDDDSSVWLITSADRRVSIWVATWHRDKCTMVDWLTFPAPCFAPDGTTISKDFKSRNSLPPSICHFHPCNPDLLIYVGYGMTKQISIYNIAKKKVVKVLDMPNWACCMGTCALNKTTNGLIVVGTDSRVVQVFDINHGTFQDYMGHSGPVNSTVFGKDSTKLFTTSHNEILIWKLKL